MATSSSARENRLAHEASPYLLQHKDNPVDWWPWGPEALSEAQRAGKPILLSVGYAACHWCHVMAHESFEDDGVAAVMNELFVNIKVDREERPDIDQIYMSALHLLGEQGGWPLTIFLTSKGEPVWGGTYFPKTARYGRPGFVDVLHEVARLFRAEPQRIDLNRRALMERLAARIRPENRVVIGAHELNALATRVADVIDPVHGGLRGAPKFPQAALFELLWRAGLRTRDLRYFELVELTLDRICQGGIYDHLGGGFSRYSVDERWLVPHFEKMLYDNAQLLELLALAFARTGRSLFAKRARETVAWLVREMTIPQGAFCASLDADSEGEEGKFYVWSLAEIEQVLGPDDAAFFAAHYDVTSAGNFEGHNILNRLNDPPGMERGPSDEQRLSVLRTKLLRIRDHRVRPGLDDKVLADWNGLMIAALVNAGTLLGEPTWIEISCRAFDFIATQMTRGDRLGHSWRDGRLLFPG
ncbi:MAG TPA: thioredoxin domain-containing protein, partial [Xanthobacteraceae bacterium]|nr:thioredoxin domain-containing protein [Xanthobacteraceae bacterium]